VTLSSNKYRIYPSPKQERKLLRYIHASRYAFNYIRDYQGFCLEAAKAELLDWNQAFIGEFDGYKLDPELRELTHWINRSVPVEIVRDGISRAVIAFKRRWSKQGGYPRHKKYGDNNSFGYSNYVKLFAKGNRTYLKVPGRMNIEVQLHKELPTGCTIKKVTISHDIDQWFASVTYEGASIPQPYVPETLLSLDEGLTSLITLSTGDKISPPKPLKQATQRVKRLQRQLAKGVKGSNRRAKKKVRLAQAHRKVRRIREYFNKYAAYRISEFALANKSVVISQDIHVKGMMRNHKLAGSFADVGIGQLKVYLAQQCTKKGIPTATIKRFEKTSGICPLCSTRHELALKDREFICCGIRHDRDHAAAQYMDKIWLDSNIDNRTSVGSTEAGRGITSGSNTMSYQPRGLAPGVSLGADRRLGLRPLDKDKSSLSRPSNEASMGPTEMYRLPDVVNTTVGSVGVISN
jgi:putative transposase